jgi:hypothetical protein
VNSVEDLARHPQLRLTEVETPDGKLVLLPADPVVWREDEDGEDIRGIRVPALDENGVDLRKEFG